MTFSVGAAVQHLLPQRLISRFVYRIARCRSPWVKAALIRLFERLYSPDLAEAVQPDPSAYADFNSFFTRALKPSARPIAGDPGEIVSPVDGTLMEFGMLESGRLLQAKGISYSLAALLGEAEGELADFTSGHFATVYLSPRDYHRVHAPCGAALLATRYIAGRRFSVSAGTARSVRGLFCRNERAVFRLAGPRGDYWLVMVGALNVSSISTATRGEIDSGPDRFWRESDPPPFRTGDELGRFNLGSTVVIVFPNERIHWRAGLRQDATLRMGERIGAYLDAGGTR